MLDLYAAIASHTIFARQDDPLADPSPTPTLLSSQAPIVVDNTPLSPIAMLAIKIYAFGGLAFLFGVILTGITYWIWVVVIKREFADSPPELDIHPERMREKEKARIARLEAKKEKRDAQRKRREEEKWRIPLRNEKIRRSRSTIPKNVPPTKSALRNPSTSPSPSNHSKSAIPAKKKHVSWASSTSTLDGDGNLKTRPLKDKHERHPASTRVPLSRLQEVLPVHPLHHHRSVSIEERSARGQELIGTLSPHVVTRWARSGVD